jgi:hypothetical protein
MIKTILYAIFRALEQSGQARARRFLSLHKGSWQ